MQAANTETLKQAAQPIIRAALTRFVASYGLSCSGYGGGL